MIHIKQGILSDNFYEREGFYHKESRKYLPLPQKFRMFLTKKLGKFRRKYGINEVPFTLGQDLEKDIHAIAICHSKFDDFNEKIGEAIVIGRIKRMRGEIRIPYDPVPEYIYKLEK